MSVTTWRPLLSGELLARARAALKEISAAYAEPAEIEAGDRPSSDGTRARAATLHDGFAGQAIYCGYQHLADDEQRPADVGLALLNHAIETVGAERMSPTLYGGFPGVVWTASHLAGRLYEPDAEDTYAETDDMVRDYVARVAMPCPFDLLHGLAGLGVYALERLPQPSARRCLEAVIDRLGEIAERDASGARWFTPPELLLSDRRQRHPRGMHDLGMAHGTPGVLALLAEAWAADVARERVGPLLEEAVTWLLAQALPPEGVSRFPTWRAPNHESTHSRLAWCYGDPGVAAALLGAAAALDRDDWRREGVATALAAARRSLEGGDVRDACLCHGSGGLAHVFNRLYQATGEEELERAALFWCERLLAAREPGRGHGGYLFERLDLPVSAYAQAPTPELYAPNAGLLNGTAGAGLVLLAATTPVEPAWDRLLMTRIAPGSCR